MELLTFTLICSLVAFILYRRWFAAPRRQFPLPPGPSPKPIIGNLFDIPHEAPWLTYANWRAVFGNIIYVHVFGKPMIILNSAKATTDLLEKRSANYSDRPRK